MAQSDREFVASHHPEARALWVDPAHNDSTSSHGGHWVIAAAPLGPGVTILGAGETRERAWSDAAARIRARGD